jgi:hypothetical protein
MSTEVLSELDLFRETSATAHHSVCTEGNEDTAMCGLDVSAHPWREGPISCAECVEVEEGFRACAGCGCRVEHD